MENLLHFLFSAYASEQVSHLNHPSILLSISKFNFPSYLYENKKLKYT